MTPSTQASEAFLDLLSGCNRIALERLSTLIITRGHYATKSRIAHSLGEQMVRAAEEARAGVFYVL